MRGIKENVSPGGKCPGRRSFFAFLFGFLDCCVQTPYFPAEKQVRPAHDFTSPSGASDSRVQAWQS